MAVFTTSGVCLLLKEFGAMTNLTGSDLISATYGDVIMFTGFSSAVRRCL